jgi:multidrug efflux pump subunit AcrA (membrane-fusion protein)
MPILLTLDSMPGKTFRAKLTAVDAQIDANGRSLLARGQLANPDGALRAGMFARARLVLRENPAALVIPEEALIPQGADVFVYRVDAGKAQRIAVKPGLRTDGKVEILSGLSEGDQVVTAGQLRLQRDGQEVALNGSSVIWSPRSNISLYGHTAMVTMFFNQGVRLGLGTDWTASGSMHMGRELACAAYLNETHYGGFFTDRELWLYDTFEGMSEPTAADRSHDGVAAQAQLDATNQMTLQRQQELAAEQAAAQAEAASRQTTTYATSTVSEAPTTPLTTEPTKPVRKRKGSLKIEPGSTQNQAGAGLNLGV